MKPEAGTLLNAGVYRPKENMGTDNEARGTADSAPKYTMPEKPESKREVNRATAALCAFLAQQCSERRLSLRSLSVNAGLSPGTVHNIIRRKDRPNLSSLNALADYLGVKREYLWQMAGLLEDMDYSTETNFSDPRVKFHFTQVDKLPEGNRNIILSVVGALIFSLKPEDGAATRNAGAQASRGRPGFKPPVV
jgi:lambda repressor-like predicted transcriptional regulator